MDTPIVRARKLARWGWLFLTSLALTGACSLARADDEEPPSWLRRKFIDPQDGKLDGSSFLESAYGFVPIGTIITDPAVGYGGGLGLIFLQPDDAGGRARPDMTAAGAFATDNGSWGAGLADARNWRNGTLKSLAAGFYASVNLEFFGTDEPLAGEPLQYNLLMRGAMGEGRMKLADSSAWLGLRYMLADVTTKFDLGNVVPGIAPAEYDQKLAGLTPLLSYDSRNNIFTPTAGVYAEAGVAVFDHALGSDSNFQLLNLTGLWFKPVAHTLTLGLKADLAASFDDVPFYLRPFAQLRGLQSMRLQGQNIADFEAELRWQASTRWSWLAFAGGGLAWHGLTDFERTRDVATGGVGIRYLAARKFGLHLGFDLAVGPDEPIIYFQFGSAWFRP